MKKQIKNKLKIILLFPIFILGCGVDVASSALTASKLKAQDAKRGIEQEEKIKKDLETNLNIGKERIDSQTKNSN